MEAIGPYRIEREVARGGMGAVYRAWDPTLERTVAIKVLPAGASASDLVRDRFRREAALLGRLRHDHLAAVHDFGVDQGAPYLVMELVEGESLADRIARGGALPAREAVCLARDVARALGYAHREGVLHRDVKPDNVMIRPDGRAVLIDFGLARATDLLDESVALSKTGEFLGTPGYWSPEQAKGDRAATSPASDVFSLGCTLYALLTGEAPFLAEGLALALAAFDRPPTPPSARNPEADAALDRIVLRCLQLQPADRYPDGEALAAALDGWLVSPASATRARPAARFALALVLAGLGAAAAVLLLARRAPAPPTPPAPSPSSSPADPGLLPLEPELQALFDRGADLMRSGDDAGGLELMDQVLARRPDYAPARANRALALRSRGDLAGALADLDRAVSLRPDDPITLMNRGDTRRMAGRLAEALQDLNRALELRPDDAGILHNRGMTRYQGGDVAGAVADFDRALALRPTQSQTWYRRGNARYRLGDARGAVEDFDRCLALDPSDASALTNRGSARYQLGDVVGALADLNRSLELRPGSATSYDSRGAVLLGLKRLDEAAADLERALELDPELAVAYDHRARLRAARGDRGGALDDWAAALQRGAGSEVQVLRARALVEDGRSAQALVELDAALQRRPRDYGLVLERAITRRQAGDAAGARADYDRALELDPSQPAAWHNRATLRFDQGDLRGALADCEEALARSPDQPETFRLSGLARSGLGQTREALADFERALALRPEHAETFLNRGVERTRIKDYAGALTDFRAAERLAPPGSDLAATAARNALLAERRLSSPR